MWRGEPADYLIEFSWITMVLWSVVTDQVDNFIIVAIIITKKFLLYIRHTIAL